MRKVWWKVLCVILLVFTMVGGLLLNVPRLAIINETVRALYFHVPMWFAMITMFITSTVFAIRYLRSSGTKNSSTVIDLDPSGDHLSKARVNDIFSVEFANAGLAFGVLGIITGSIWAKYAWGTWWHGDPKLNGAAITLLIYLAYFVLRGSLNNEEQRARLSAVYNIFAFAAMIPLIFIIPRMTDSMHPGNGGNPGFNMYDLDSRMRPVFYIACLGWILLSGWVATVRVRLRIAEETIAEIESQQAA